VFYGLRRVHLGVFPSCALFGTRRTCADLRFLCAAKLAGGQLVRGEQKF
jgi:hypothetical protein